MLENLMCACLGLFLCKLLQESSVVFLRKLYFFAKLGRHSLTNKITMSESPKEKKSPVRPVEKVHGHFLLPSPIPTRRMRTTSQSKLASESPLQTGTCKSFCRQKGHGFIVPDDGDRDIFVHISDIEGELVLKAGDKVTYRTVPLPPKCVEQQAVEVVITTPNGPHDTWSTLSHSVMTGHSL